MLLECLFSVKNVEDAPAPETLEPCITLTTKMTLLWLDFPILKTCFLYQFNYIYFRKCAENYVEICNIYANQMVIKVARSTINSDKLIHSFDNLYLGVIFGDTG